MYDVIRLHYDHAVTSQLFWLAPLSDEILDVVTSKRKKGIKSENKINSEIRKKRMKLNQRRKK
jgi:hypothetical protein